MRANQPVIQAEHMERIEALRAELLAAKEDNAKMEERVEIHLLEEEGAQE